MNVDTCLHITAAISTHLSVDQLQLSLDVSILSTHSQCKDHLHLAVHVHPSGPVAVASHPSSLLLLGQQHNAGTLVLPDHPPEVTDCVRERTLCSYEGVLLYIE